MILKIHYMDLIRLDDELLLLLAKANSVRVGSVLRWLKPDNRKGNRMLTMAENLAIIAKHYGVNDTKDLLEEETITEGAVPGEATNIHTLP